MPTIMRKRPRFTLGSLLWVVALVAVFLGARSPLFDSLFSSFKSDTKLVLRGGPQMTSQSDPEVVSLTMINASTCVLRPKKAGMCIVEFKTPHGIEVYIVNVSPMMNVRVQETNLSDGVTSKLSNGKSVRDVLDEAFGPAEPEYVEGNQTGKSNDTGIGLEQPRDARE